MKTDKLERLQAAGWKTGNAEDFLELSDEEARLVALKLALISAVKKITHQTQALANRSRATHEIEPIAHCQNRSGRSFSFAGFDRSCAHRKRRNNT